MKEKETCKPRKKEKRDCVEAMKKISTRGKELEAKERRYKKLEKKKAELEKSFNEKIAKKERNGANEKK